MYTKSRSPSWLPCRVASRRQLSRPNCSATEPVTLQHPGQRCRAVAATAAVFQDNMRGGWRVLFPKNAALSGVRSR